MIIIAGPCQMESYSHGVESAEYLSEFMSQYPVEYYYKASYDKANRTSADSPRGCGMYDLIRAFRSLKRSGIKTLTDVHSVWDCNDCELNSVTNVYQIPALLSRQTDIIQRAANPYDKPKIVNIKKGQFMSPHDMKYAAQKAKRAKEVWLTERGTMFGYGDLIVDFRNLRIMKEENPDAKIVFDCTHSTQSRKLGSNTTEGDWTLALPLAKSALNFDVDGIFLETHETPEKAKSDGPCMIPHSELQRFMDELLK
jgi:2-dehydro-3-deoxyphosphooctonate aldolase (KDO 8-P synthase)